MNDNIEILLAKYFANELDESGNEVVEEWKNLSQVNRVLFDQYKHLWSEAKQSTNYTDQQVEQALIQTKQRMPEFRKRRSMVWLRQIAAIFIFSLILSSLFQYLNNPKAADSGVVIKEVAALKGVKTKLTLPDGTVVDLFPGSKLLYPVDFGSEERSVKLTGEGYFNVTHNKNLPFVVKADGLNIKVLGTEFNVRAYNDDDYIETVLVKGKVQLEKEVNGKIVPVKTLKPNQRVVYNRSTNKFDVYKQADVNRYIAWTKGALVFDAEPLNEVVRELEMWYNVDIEIKDKELEKFKFTGMFNSEPIEEVMSLLQYSSEIKYKITKDYVNNDGKYVHKKIVLTN